MSEVPVAADPIETQSQEAAPLDTVAVVRHLSHELRQPLSVMESIAYYLKLVVPRHEAKAHGQIAKLEQLVDQMDWILADAAHFLQASLVRPQLADLCEIVADSVTAGRVRNLQIEYARQPVLVRLDPGQGRHLLSSVFHFAQQAVVHQSIIHTAVLSDAGEALVELRVPGPEISREAFAEMCEPFSPHLPAGSGLALASARRIAEVHGGRIEAWKDPGYGTTLRVSLPAA